MKEIIQKEHKTLRKIAKEVNIKNITAPEIKGVISDMRESLYSQDDGVALAAPQINKSLRIFVVSEKIFGEDGPPKK